MLEKLGEDATVFVKNENKLNNLLEEWPIQSRPLKANVELDESNVTQITEKSQDKSLSCAEGRE